MKANGNEIRNRRELLGLSAEALADICKLSVKTILRAERGESLTAANLKLIADALGCTVKEIAVFDERVTDDIWPHSTEESQAEQQAVSQSVVLIPAAGPVSDGLFTHVTVQCPSLFPVGGKPTIHWQLGWLRDQGFKKFFIAVAGGKEQLEISIKSAFPELKVSVIVDKELGGVGRTVKRLLEAALKESSSDARALVVLGDTIAHFPTQRNITVAETQSLSPVDWNSNWVLYDFVSDSKRWCIWKQDSPTEPAVFEEKHDFALDDYGPQITWKALTGVYYFSNASKALKALNMLDEAEELRNRPLEMSYILNHLSGDGIKFVKALFWADVGHPDRLIAAHADLLALHGMKEREFNKVSADLRRGTIKKTLSEKATNAERSKFIDEIEYYARLPEPLKIYFPRVVSAQTSWNDPSLTLEYYAYSSLSDYWVYGTLDSDVWGRIFEHLRGIFREFAAFKRPVVDEKALREMYVGKSHDRFERLRKDLIKANGDEHAVILRGLLNGETYTYQGHSLPNLATLINDLPPKAQSLLQECPTFTVIHGDSGFPNILIQLPSGICKLVDPRGSFGSTNGVHGDQYYDCAKINHSLEGYDFIVNDLFALKCEKRDIDLNVFYPAGHARVVERFNGVFLAGEGAFNANRVRLITGLLFASMLPLHSNHRRQLAMYITAARLLAPWFSI